MCREDVSDNEVKAKNVSRFYINLYL
jgi:hypothetical protein